MTTKAETQKLFSASFRERGKEKDGSEGHQTHHFYDPSLVFYFFLDFFLSDPWTMGFSKKTNRKFFYNKKTRLSTFDLPVDSIAPFQ